MVLILIGTELSVALRMMVILQSILVVYWLVRIGFASIWGVNRWDNHWRMALDQIFFDSEVYRDYDRDGFEQNQWHNNAFELAYEGEDLIISVSTVAGK